MEIKNKHSRHKLFFLNNMSIIFKVNLVLFNLVLFQYFPDMKGLIMYWLNKLGTCIRMEYLEMKSIIGMVL
jgi:hypothetical protein